MGIAANYLDDSDINKKVSLGSRSIAYYFDMEKISLISKLSIDKPSNPYYTYKYSFWDLWETIRCLPWNNGQHGVPLLAILSIIGMRV